MRLDVRSRTTATAIDRAARTITLETGGADGTTQTLAYDALVLAPGAYAVTPPIPGIDHPRVRTLRTVPDAEALRSWVTEGATRAVVLGAGFIGLEAAEGLRHAGLEVAVIEAAPHVLPIVDPEIAHYVRAELQAHGVAVHEGVAATSIADASGRPVVTLADGTVLPTDLVVLSVGVKPRTELAESAGLELTGGGAIVVDDAQLATIESAATRPPRLAGVASATGPTASVTAWTLAVASPTAQMKGSEVRWASSTTMAPPPVTSPTRHRDRAGLRPCRRHDRRLTAGPGRPGFPHRSHPQRPPCRLLPRR